MKIRINVIVFGLIDIEVICIVIFVELVKNMV